MDRKELLIDEILLDLTPVCKPSQIKDIQIILRKRMNNIIVEDKNETYDIATVDETNHKLLTIYHMKKSLSGLSQNSINQYYRTAKLFLDACNKPVKDITSEDVELYLLSQKMRNNVSNTSLNNTRSYLNNFFSFLHSNEYIGKNPMDKVARIKRDTIHDSAFTIEEEERLYLNTTNLRDRALLEILFSTGCRVSEVVGMTINSVDFSNKKITVIGKGNKQRTVPVSDKALLHLKRYLDTRTDSDISLFVSRRKPYKSISADTVETVIKEVGAKARVSNCYPHRCRATLATRLLNKGMNIQLVQTILGHESIDTTMIYYRGDNNNASSEYAKLVNN